MRCRTHILAYVTGVSALASGCIVPDPFSVHATSSAGSSAVAGGMGGRSNALDSGGMAGRSNALDAIGAGASSVMSLSGAANHPGSATPGNTAGDAGATGVVGASGGVSASGGSSGGPPATVTIGGTRGTSPSSGAGGVSGSASDRARGGSSPMTTVSTGGVFATSAANSAAGRSTTGGTLASSVSSSLGGTTPSSVGAVGGSTAAGSSNQGGADSSGGATTGTTGFGGASSAGASNGGAAGDRGLLNGCVLLMHMDELSWNARANEVLDGSGYGNHGTPTKSSLTTTDSPAKAGRAGLFDGAGYIDVADNASLRPSAALTVSAWFYRTADDGAERGIVVKRLAWRDQDSFSIFIWGGEPRDPSNVLVYVDVDDDNDRFTSDPSKPLAINTWYHVIVVFDGDLPVEDRVRLYLNGEIQGLYDNAHQLVASSHKETSSRIPEYPVPLHVGDLQNGGYSFIGVIDEVMIWNRALSREEIAALDR